MFSQLINVFLCIMERLQHMLQQHVMCCKLQNVKKILNTISSQKKNTNMKV